MATEKYVNGTGLGYLWTKMKATFLLSSEEMSAPDMVNRKFATLDDTNPHSCGNSVSGMQGTRKIIPLQVSPDFNGSTGCYIYESYTSSSQRVFRNVYQLNSSGKLYTVPTSGAPSVVQSLSYIDGGITNSDGFYALQDVEYGNWWISNTNTIITAEELGIVAQAAPSQGGGGDPVIIPQEESSYYITGIVVDPTMLSDTPSDWWSSDNAYAYIRLDDDSPFSMFFFSTAVTTNGGTRVCKDVSDGVFIWDYTLTRTNANTVSISRTRSHIMPSNPE